VDGVTVVNNVFSNTERTKLQQLRLGKTPDGAYGISNYDAAIDATTKVAVVSGRVTGYQDADTINTNPLFDNWSGAVPDGWVDWSTGTTVKDTSNTRSSANSVRFSSTGTGDSGISFNQFSVANYEYLEVHMEVMLLSGDFKGAGVLVDWRPQSTYRKSIGLHTILPSPTLNVWHSVKVIAKRPANELTGTFSYKIYLMGNYSGLAGGKSNKTIIFNNLSVKPASEAAILAYNSGAVASALATTAREGAVVDAKLDSELSNRLIKAGSVLYLNDKRGSIESINTTTNYAGGNKFSFTTTISGDAFLHILLEDAEGGLNAGLNNTGLGNMTGPDNAEIWYTFPCTVISGSNEISIWSTSTDGASIKGLVVTNGVADPSALLNSTDSNIDGRANNRIDSLLGEVDNKNSATLTAEAIAQAKLESLLLNNSGAGSNFFNGKYQNPDTRTTLVATNVNSANNVINTGAHGQPSGGNCYLIVSTTNDGYIYLAKNSTDYNTPIITNRKWLVSMYIKAVDVDSAYRGVNLYMRLSDASNTFRGKTTSMATGAAGQWVRVSTILDCENFDAYSCLIRIDNDGGAGKKILYDQIMLELYVEGGDGSPSSYSPPINQYRLKDQQTIPMINSAGASAAMNVNPLAGHDVGSTARITVGSHSVQM
jgi:hypothetical protein